MELLQAIFSSWLTVGTWWLGFFIVFGFLAKLTPCNPGQPLLRPGLITDALYGLLIPVFTRLISIVLLSSSLGLIFYGTSHEEMQQYYENGYGWLSTWPIWLQAATIFLVSDFILYWTHRLFHTGSLWRWHAIHHSSKHVDWLSTHRFHPFNIWLTFTLVDVFMLSIGFSPEAIGTMSIFNMLYSAMVHANLNWTFGPFKYLFASPVFHRWHHTSQQEGLDKNFAPTIPLIDIAFGTFYMPDGKVPEHFGVDGADIPESFIGQLLWPFKQR